MKIFISHSPAETQTHSYQVLKLALRLKINVICLYGELGAGKTTFVQGLAWALGVKKRVLSPTFVLLREYPLPRTSKLNLVGRGPTSTSLGQFSILTHLDCYRLKTDTDLKAIDFKELCSNSKNLIVVEWPEKLAKLLPKKRIELKFKYLDENKRKITIVNCQ